MKTCEPQYKGNGPQQMSRPGPLQTLDNNRQGPLGNKQERSRESDIKPNDSTPQIADEAWYIYKGNNFSR